LYICVVCVLCCARRCMACKQLVLHLYCLSTRACAAPERVYHQELLCWCCTRGSVYKSFVLHQDVSAYKSFKAAPGRVSVYKSLCCTCANLSTTQELCDAPGRFCLQESGPRCTCKCTVEKMFWVCFGLFRNRYVCFGCFDDTCSKLRNKLK
jgi:hypothetical protein